MDAMRSMVGDRDLKAVRAAAAGLDQEIANRALTIHILARGLGSDNDLSRLLLYAQEIPATFDGGIGLYSPSGSLLAATNPASNWADLPRLLPDTFTSIVGADGRTVFSPPVTLGENQAILVGVTTANGNILTGVFSPAALIQRSLLRSASMDQTTILVIAPSATDGGYIVLYNTGSIPLERATDTLFGFPGALQGKSGIDYYNIGTEEHVLAYSPIPSIGWGLILDEPWQETSGDYLRVTQQAPLLLVPVVVLSLVALWFGARRIVQPLQNLEKQASLLAKGDFKAIRDPVGGIQEIQSLQAQLIEMADKLQTANQSLHNYIGAITAGIENERRSLARELHDETIQSLIALNQHIQLAAMNAPDTQQPNYQLLGKMVQETIGNLRRMIRGLRPIYLEDLGLAASLEMLCQETSQLSQIPVNFNLQGQERRLDTQKEMALYRMVQEALSNVARHSQAHQAAVWVKYGEQSLHITVEDDGKGFLLPVDSTTLTVQSHFGLLSLRERAELIGANLLIRSQPGKGTVISMEVSYDG